VREEVQRWKQRSAEVFMPLTHPPGEAQADFGTATVIYRGRKQQAALFVISLLFSDAFFCQLFPRECTETFQEGHRRAREFFAGVPRRISYDNTKIAVAKVIQKRGGILTRETATCKAAVFEGDRQATLQREFVKILLGAPRVAPSHSTRSRTDAPR
jgi:hypothetical protein